MSTFKVKSTFYSSGSSQHVVSNWDCEGRVQGDPTPHMSTKPDPGSSQQSTKTFQPTSSISSKNLTTTVVSKAHTGPNCFTSPDCKLPHGSTPTRSRRPSSVELNWKKGRGDEKHGNKVWLFPPVYRLHFHEPRRNSGFGGVAQGPRAWNRLSLPELRNSSSWADVHVFEPGVSQKEHESSTGTKGGSEVDLKQA